MNRSLTIRATKVLLFADILAAAGFAAMPASQAAPPALQEAIGRPASPVELAAPLCRR